MQSQWRAGRPASQSQAVEGPMQAANLRMEGRKQNMEQQAARLVEGPQSNAASQVEGRPAGQAMQQQAASLGVERGPNGRK